VNGDGKVDVADVQLTVVVALATANVPVLSSGNILGDINGDENVNAIDVQRVVNAVLGFGCNTAH
jgi:hypothetical protein